jgi:tetratricopeptide (TPR) repeat protein
MPRVIRIVIIVALGMGTSVSAGYPLPRGSEQVAARQNAWRTLLEDAQDAVEADLWEEAEGLFESVIEQTRAANKRGMMLARALDGLAAARQRTSRFDDAARLYGEAAELWERLLGPAQPRLGVTLHNLGLSYIELERPDDARRSLERALSIFENSFGTASSQAVNTRTTLSRLTDS